MPGEVCGAAGYDSEGLYLLGETMLRLNRVAEAKEAVRESGEKPFGRCRHIGGG